MSKKYPTARVINLVASRRFFWAIVILLVVQAAWIALSGRYPMAFDEDFHLGIIRLYAHHLSPFWSSHPPGADAYGAVARDPSYLYQWLMSFPYRFISAFTADQTIQVLVLRFINIGLFAAGLPLLRRLLLKTGASRAAVHLCLLLFVLVPIVPLLAAQINYDNLFIPAMAVSLLLAIRFNESLRRDQPVNLPLLLSLVIACLLTSLIKYVFLPMLLGLAVLLLVRLRHTSSSWQKVAQRLLAGSRRVNRLPLIVLVIGVVASAGLDLQRYGYNVVHYHTPVPDCGAVLSYEHCISYGPWARDFYDKQLKGHTTYNPVLYAGDWLHGMWFRLFFTLDGRATNFQTRGPLLIPAIGSLLFSGFGLYALARSGRAVWRRYQRPVLAVLLAAAGPYVAVLWLDNYLAFLETGQPVAISGRYLLPILPILLLVMALAISELCRKRPALKPTIAAVAVLSLLWGGGALTYILRSNDAWYWPAQPVYDANHAVQNILGPLTPGYRQPLEFLY